MKTPRFLTVHLFLILTLFLTNAFAEDPTQWHLPKEAKVRIGKGWVLDNIAFSPDNTLLAVPSAIGIWIYNAQTGEALKLLTGHTDVISCLAFSPDGQSLATSGGYDDNTVRLWDVQTGAHRMTLTGHTRRVNSVAFSPDGRTLASAGNSKDSTVRLWDTETGTHKMTLFGHIAGVESVAFSPDGQTLATGGGYTDNTVQLWDAETGTHKMTLIGHTGNVSLAFSPDGQTLATGGGWTDTTVRLWHLATGELKTTLIGHAQGVTSVAFHPDGKILVSGSKNTICVWDVTSGTYITTLPEGAGSVVFSSDGHQLASSREGSVVLWDALSLDRRLTLTGHLARVSAIAFSPDSRTLASGNWDRKVRLWDTATGNHITTLIGHVSDIRALAFSPDGKTLASGGSWNDPTVRLWDLPTGTQKPPLVGHLRSVEGVAFSPDGKTLASVSSDQNICLWDVTTGYHRATLTWNHTVGISGRARLRFSPDGHTLAVGGKAGVHLWNLTRSPYKIRWSVHTPAQSFAFSPNGQTLAVGKRDGTLVLWDAISREEKATLTAHTDYFGVGTLAFSSDSRTLASTGWHEDKTIRLWDVRTGSHQWTLTGHTERVSSLAFSRDGKMLASASSDGTILLWKFPPAHQTFEAPRLLTTDGNGDAPGNALFQNYPNPFNPETWIPYHLSEPAAVTLRIYTARGTLIRTLAVGHRPAGIYRHRHEAVYWDGKNENGEPVASGVYFYTLAAGDFRATRKMLIRK